MRKNSIPVFVSVLFAVLLLSSCITTSYTFPEYSVEPAVAVEKPEEYEAVASMSKNYSVKYTFFTSTQNPSDEEIAARIQSETEKKYGKDAIAANLVFAKKVTSTTDVGAALTGSISIADGDKYTMITRWDVLKPKVKSGS